MIQDYVMEMDYLTNNYVYNPSVDLINTEYTLEEYHQISILRSNCIEFWAPVTDKVIPNIIPGKYWVSTYGKIFDTETQRPVGISIHGKGYYQVPFRTLDGKRITRKLHRIILLTFCYVAGYESLEVNHIDSNRTNNNLENLEWTTPSENTIHGILYGNKKVFNEKIDTIIPDKEILEIYDLYKSGFSIKI